MRVKTPLHFHSKLKRLKALYTKFVERVRHYAGNHGFHWNSEEEEDFWMIVLSEELFD